MPNRTEVITSLIQLAGFARAHATPLIWHCHTIYLHLHGTALLFHAEPGDGRTAASLYRC